MDEILNLNLDIKKCIHNLDLYDIKKSEIVDDIKNMIINSKMDNEYKTETLQYLYNIKTDAVDIIIEKLNGLILANERYVENKNEYIIWDYSDMVIKNYNTISNIIYETFNDIYIFETDFIRDLIDNVYMIHEAKVGYTIGKNVASGSIKAGKAITKTTKNILDALLGLIQSVQEAFLSKHKKITERDLKWLKENESKLRQIDTNHIEINIHSDFKKRLADARTVYNSFTSIIENNINTIKDYEEFKSKIKPFTDSNGDLKNGLINRYRTGSSNSSYTINNMKGKAIQNVIPDLISYCRDFISEYNNMNKMCKDSATFIKRLQKESRIKGVKESYCYIEESLYSATDLGLFYDFNMVTEDDQTGTTESNPDNKSNSTQTNNNDDRKIGVEKRNDIKEQIDGMDKNTLSLYNKICRDKHLGMTAFMTATEKKYFESITILRGLISNQKQE